MTTTTPAAAKPVRRSRGRPAAGDAPPVGAVGAVGASSDHGSASLAAGHSCCINGSSSHAAPRAVYGALGVVPPPAAVAIAANAAIDHCAVGTNGDQPMAECHTQLTSMSDDENVILKLSFVDAHDRQPPDPYDVAAAEAFSSHPCSVPEEAWMAPIDAEPAAMIGHALTLTAAAATSCSATSVGISNRNGSGGGCKSSIGIIDGIDAASGAAAAPGAHTAHLHEHGNAHASGAANMRLIKLLTEFEEKSKVGEWPLSTSVHCYWCCHRFGNTPFGLPIKYAHERYHVTGCFCSLECAAAYNFATRDSLDECLHRYSLINSLACRIGLGLGRVVRPAPCRLALDIFGGHMSIDDFRAFTQSSRHIIVNSPPMMAVSQQVEEMNVSDLRSEYKYIPLDTDRVVRFQEKIRLKRSKPVVNFKNTLDHAMRVKIVPT